MEEPPDWKERKKKKNSDSSSEEEEEKDEFEGSDSEELETIWNSDKEIWISMKPIGFSKYSLSNKKQVKRNKTSHILKESRNKGSMVVTIIDDLDQKEKKRSINALTKELLKEKYKPIEEKENQIWRTLNPLGYPDHMISNLKQIKNIKTNTILKGFKKGNKLKVRLYTKEYIAKGWNIDDLHYLMFPEDYEKINDVDIKENDYKDEIWSSLDSIGYSMYSLSTMKRVRNDETNIILNGHISHGKRNFTLKSDHTGTFEIKNVEKLMNIIYPDNSIKEYIIVIRLGILGYNNYGISRNGQVVNLNTNEWLGGSENDSGYPIVNLIGNDGKNHIESIHALLAKIFIPNPENKPTVDHINRTKTDYDINNLRWATYKEQAENRTKPDYKRGRPVYQLNIEDPTIIITKWDSATVAAENFNINHTAIIQAINDEGTSVGFRWQYCDVFDDNPKTLWVPLEIEGYEIIYVSDTGLIKTHHNYITKGSKTKKYRYHNLIPIDGSKEYKTVMVHKLILLGFLGENPGKVPNHLNGIKDDNRLENLEYATQKESVRHAVETGLIKSRAVNQYTLEGIFIKKFINANEVYRQLKLDPSSILDTCKQKIKSLNKRKFLWAFTDSVPEGNLSLDYFMDKRDYRKEKLDKLRKSIGE
jgi:hypothetical protein